MKATDRAKCRTNNCRNNASHAHIIDAFQVVNYQQIGERIAVPVCRKHSVAPVMGGGDLYVRTVAL